MSDYQFIMNHVISCHIVSLWLKSSFFPVAIVVLFDSRVLTNIVHGSAPHRSASSVPASRPKNFELVSLGTWSGQNLSIQWVQMVEMFIWISIWVRDLTLTYFNYWLSMVESWNVLNSEQFRTSMGRGQVAMTSAVYRAEVLPRCWRGSGGIFGMTSKGYSGYSTEASAGSSIITLQHQPPFKWSPNLLRTLRQPNSSRAETTIMGGSCHNSPWRQLDLALLTAPCVFLHFWRVFQSWPGRSIGHLEEVPTLHLGVHISQEHPMDPITSNYPKKGNTELLAARQTQPSLVPVVALDGEHVQFRPWGSLHGNWWNLNVHGLSLRLSKT